MTTFAIYLGSMGLNSKEVVRSGFSTLDEAVAEFHAMKGDTIAFIEKDEDGHEAYDALVVRGAVTECWTIEAAK